MSLDVLAAFQEMTQVVYSTRVRYALEEYRLCTTQERRAPHFHFMLLSNPMLARMW